MMSPTVYHVARAWDEEYGWEIRAEGAARAQTLFQSRDEAFAAARRLARAQPGTPVYLHHADGSVEPCPVKRRE